MGDAVAAIVGGTHAIEWNPAGVARAAVPMAGLGLGITPANSDLQFNTAVLYPLPDGTVFALSQFSDFPNSPSSGTTYVGTVALPLNSSRDFLLGLNLKYLAFSTPANGTLQKGQGLGLDFGVSYDLREPRGTIASFALAVKDASTEVRFNDNSEQPAVRTFILGAAYQDIPDARVEMDYDIVDQTLVNSNLHNRLRLGAERFFDNRFYSFRIGYDDLFNNDGYFSLGVGYHPDQPYELSYAFRFSTNSGAGSHFLSFIYRFDDFGKKGPAAPVTEENKSTASPEIDLKSISALVESTPTTGKPVSAVPLRKLAIVPSPEVFSPAGKQKTTEISFPGDNVPDISRWMVAIQTDRQKVVRRFAGTGPLAPFFAWDGLDENGKSSPEGKYQIALKTFNKKNDLLSDDLGNVEILSPRLHFGIQAASDYFSTHSGPKDKREETFTVNPGGPPDVQSWDFEISEASSNKVVFEKQGKARLPKRVKWDGKNSEGLPAGDGPYLCLLVAQDKAGNPLKTDAVEVVLANTPPELTLKGQDSWADFSHGKGFHYALNAADRVGIADWKLTLSDENGRPLKKIEASGEPPRDLAWDGTLDGGKAVEPGSFVKAVFSATDKAGNGALSEPVPVQVDYHPPSGEQMSLSLLTVHFNAQTSDLSEEAKKEIKDTADSIKKSLAKSLLVVKGYASPTEKGDLLSLSRARALEVKKQLVKELGIPDNGVYALGYALREPLASSPNAVTEDPQRRAVITLTTLSQ